MGSKLVENRAKIEFRPIIEWTAIKMHGALDGKDACLECHDPHAASRSNLLAKTPSKSCFSCHSQVIKVSDTKEIPDIKDLISKSKHVHEPVKKGECQECHDGHGSVYGDLLVQNFSTEFYQTYSNQRYKLCFKCHDQELVASKRTTKTAFRNGDNNLHYVHVNRVKGRSCGVCHESHGSEQEKLMKSSTPFGPSGWPLTIEFRKTAKGGSCASACHADKAYDRTAIPAKGKGIPDEH